jgi:acyl-CoA thioesterase I
MLIGLVAAPCAWAQSTLPAANPDDRCLVTVDALFGKGALPHAAAAVASGAPLTIVALGSSSTQGYGSTKADRTYPAQLAMLLQQRFPQSRVSVINKGIGGNIIDDMMARLTSDVLALRPQLVIWQTGTNDALRGVPPQHFRASLLRGVGEMRRNGIDVVLMSPQYAPQVVAVPDHDLYLDIMRETALRERVMLFRRFTLSQHWTQDRHFGGDSVIGSDGLHQTDASYHCTALLLANAIAAQATPITHASAARK